MDLVFDYLAHQGDGTANPVYPAGEAMNGAALEGAAFFLLLGVGSCADGLVETPGGLAVLLAAWPSLACWFIWPAPKPGSGSGR